MLGDLVKKVLKKLRKTPEPLISQKITLPILEDEKESQMLTTTLMKDSLKALKTTIKGRAQTSQWMRQEANKLSGMAKHQKHLEMRSYGNGTRYYLLAYGLLRGKAYRDIEQSTHTKPWTGQIHTCLSQFMGNVNFWTLDEIDRWKNTETQEIPPLPLMPEPEVVSSL